MNPPSSNRLLLLGGIALLLLGILIARWLADWGLVTIHVKNAPASQVVASISRQGHVTVESSLDPADSVTMDVDKVPPVVAIDMLATRTDASWRAVYLAAPTRAALHQALVTLRGIGKLDDWTTYFYPGPPAAGETGLVIDPRYLDLRIEGPDQDLSKLMNEASQKSGVMTALPSDWSPTVPKLPKENQVRRALPALIASAHGEVAAFFLLTQNHREDIPNNEAGGDAAGPRPSDAAAMNPDWSEQRQLAQIQLLPPAQRVVAKKEFDDRKALVAQLMKLSPEERMAKVREMMSNPDNFLSGMDQIILRLASQPADRRINMAVNYLNQKAAIQSSQRSPAETSLPTR
jgi:hypothetical protein